MYPSGKDPAEVEFKPNLKEECLNRQDEQDLDMMQ